MGRSFSGADDAGNWLLAFVFHLRPRVNHKQQYRPDKPNRLPAITVWVWIMFRCVQWVIEYTYRGFERQMVLRAVRGCLLRIPDPTQDREPFVTTNMSLQR